MRSNLTAKRPAIVVQQNGKGGTKEFTPRQDDKIETAQRLVASEELAHLALRVIPSNRLPQAPRCHDTQPADRACIRSPDERHVPPTRPNSVLLNLQKLRAPPNALIACQCPGRVRLTDHGLLPGDGQTPAPLRSSPAEHATTAGSAHPYAETVRLLAVAVIRLEGALHLNQTPQQR
jgi:hypothetical protein